MSRSRNPSALADLLSVAQAAATEGSSDGVQQSASPADTPEVKEPAPSPEPQPTPAPQPEPAQDEGEQRVPYDRFAKVTEENKQLRARLEALERQSVKPTTQQEPSSPPMQRDDEGQLRISPEQLRTLEKGLAKLEVANAAQGLSSEQLDVVANTYLEFAGKLDANKALAYARVTNPELFADGGSAGAQTADRSRAASHAVVQPRGRNESTPKEPTTADYRKAIMESKSVKQRRGYLAEWLNNVARQE